jgi:hypothetical protein
MALTFEDLSERLERYRDDPAHPVARNLHALFTEVERSVDVDKATDEREAKARDLRAAKPADAKPAIPAGA